jgi:hypothetical protein
VPVPGLRHLSFEKKNLGMNKGALTRLVLWCVFAVR